MNKSLLTYERIRGIMQKKGYRFYTDPYDMNIIGVRTLDNTVNKFNDFIQFLYCDGNGVSNIYVIPASTDPGLFWLENPENSLGTAILKEGQYPACWQVGLHRGEYRALVQVKPMTVYRDSKRDGNLDIILGSEDTGLFGINFHHAGEDSQNVDKWSAGCQVAQKLQDFEVAMNMVDLQNTANLGNVFSYTLLNERDFI